MNRQSLLLLQSYTYINQTFGRFDWLATGSRPISSVCLSCHSVLLRVFPRTPDSSHGFHCSYGAQILLYQQLLLWRLTLCYYRLLPCFPCGCTQARLQHLVNITSLYGNHCASFNRNLASFTILYYWTSSPQRRVLLQLNLQYSHLTVCGYLLTVHESSVTLTNVFLVVVLLTEGDELLLLINELESREGRLSLFFLVHR